MIENQIKLCRKLRNNAPVLKRRPKPVTLQRRRKPVTLQRRRKPVTLQRRRKPVTLQRRRKPDVFYCEKRSIKNRLPYPIECTWIGNLYECCRNCTKKVKYNFWKRGTYDRIAKTLEDQTYKTNSSEEENIHSFIAKEEGW